MHENLQQGIESHLEKIEKILGPSYKLTLIATHDGSAGLDADILLTMAKREDMIRPSTASYPRIR